MFFLFSVEPFHVQLIIRTKVGYRIFSQRFCLICSKDRELPNLLALGALRILIHGPWLQPNNVTITHDADSICAKYHDSYCHPRQALEYALREEELAVSDREGGKFGGE